MMGREELEVGQWYIFEDGSFLCIDSPIKCSDSGAFNSTLCSFRAYGFVASGMTVPRYSSWTMREDDKWRKATKKELLSKISRLF